MSSATMELANRAANAGHKVLIDHTCGNYAIRECVKMMGERVKLVTKNQALKARIIVLFIPLHDLQNFMLDLPDMRRKILIFPNNAIFGNEFLKTRPIKSSSEIIASLLPEANVIKLYSLIEPNVIFQKKQSGDGNQIFYSGGNIKTTQIVESFFKTLGLEAIEFEVDH